MLGEVTYLVILLKVRVLHITLEALYIKTHGSRTPSAFFLTPSRGKHIYFTKLSFWCIYSSAFLDDMWLHYPRK